MNLKPTISYLTNIHFGRGMAQAVPQILESLDCRRPLVVSDRGLVACGMIERLGRADPVVFADVVSNPTEAGARAGLEMYRARDTKLERAPLR